jgi:hypothetical protein
MAVGCPWVRLKHLRQTTLAHFQKRLAYPRAVAQVRAKHWRGNSSGATGVLAHDFTLPVNFHGLIIVLASGTIIAIGECCQACQQRPGTRGLPLESIFNSIPRLWEDVAGYGYIPGWRRQ